MNQRSGRGNLLLAGILTAGATLAAVVAVILASMAYHWILRPPEKISPFVDLWFDHDGNVCVYSGDRAEVYMRQGYHEMQGHYVKNVSAIKTLDGTPIDVQDQRDGVAAANLYRVPLAEDSRYANWNARLQKIELESDEVWYLVRDDAPAAHAYFEGFSKTKRRSLGFLGTTGFTDRRPELQDQFPIVGDVEMPGRVIFVNSGMQVFRLDLERRKATPIDTGNERVWNISSGGANGWNGEGRSWIAVRTDHSIYLIHDDDSRRVVPLTGEIERAELLQVAERKDGGVSIVRWDVGNLLDKTREAQVYTVDAAGDMSAPITVTVTREAAYEYKANRAIAVIGSPVLFAADAAQCYVVTEAGFQREGLWAAIFGEDGPFFWLSALIGAGLAAVCLRRQRLYQVPRVERIGWPIFVFLFGVPGWVGYRYCRRWPPLEVCPACRRPALRNDESCAVCGREFPLPAMKGTEIFV